MISSACVGCGTDAGEAPLASGGDEVVEEEADEEGAEAASSEVGGGSGSEHPEANVYPSSIARVATFRARPSRADLIFLKSLSSGVADARSLSTRLHPANLGHVSPHDSLDRPFSSNERACGTV